MNDVAPRVGAEALITQVQPDSAPQRKAALSHLRFRMAANGQGAISGDAFASEQSEKPSQRADGRPASAASSNTGNNSLLARATALAQRLWLGCVEAARRKPSSLGKSAGKRTGSSLAGEPRPGGEILRSVVVAEETTPSTATLPSPLGDARSDAFSPTAAAPEPAPAVVAPAPPVPERPHGMLLPPLAPEDTGKICLVLDLDETLVHSSFKAVANADFTIPVEIDNIVHNVFVLKRPGVDEFLARLGPQFEVVVFTASLAKYADPVLDTLDRTGAVKHRLFRESCINHKGNFVKDLSIIGRDLRHVVIIDNSPASYIFHPTNAIPITSWFSDPNDRELLELIPFLEDLKRVDDVTLVLDQSAL